MHSAKTKSTQLREVTHAGVKGQSSTFRGGEINAAGRSGKDRVLVARRRRQRGKAAFSLSLGQQKREGPAGKTPLLDVMLMELRTKINMRKGKTHEV